MNYVSIQKIILTSRPITASCSRPSVSGTSACSGTWRWTSPVRAHPRPGDSSPNGDADYGDHETIELFFLSNEMHKLPMYSSSTCFVTLRFIKSMLPILTVSLSPIYSSEISNAQSLSLLFLSFRQAAQQYWLCEEIIIFDRSQMCNHLSTNIVSVYKSGKE